MTSADISHACSRIRDNIAKIIVGKENETDLIISALLANGHVLIEDVPGTGKTMLAKALALSLDLQFRRIQFTPDLLPQELTGVNFYNPKTGEFSFREGALFTNILLADEINRATPRTQSGLLESMEERQITIDGTTRVLDKPYFVIATQNPVETQGTYPLPEAQLDRFMIRVPLGYPSKVESVNMLKRFMGSNPLNTLSTVTDRAELLQMQAFVKTIFVCEDIMSYIIELAEATRKNEKIKIGISSRGALILMHMAQSFAAVKGRDFVTPDDIQMLLPYVFGHRLITASAYRSGSQIELLNEIAASVAVPTENWEMPAVTRDK